MGAQQAHFLPVTIVSLSVLFAGEEPQHLLETETSEITQVQ